MSTFEQLDQQFRPIIQTALDEYTQFNLTDNRNRLAEAIRYSLLANSKRIRPLLCIATQQLFNTDITRMMPVACAIEMVHTYSLIHDDLPAMDDDDFRRGQPTCHKQYGEDIAILAGDVLNTFAFELISRELPKTYSAEKVIRVIQDLAISFGLEGMAGGQALDLSGDKDQDEAYLRTTHALKTGAILKHCITIPAFLENASDSEQAVLAKFGDHIGLLFQIVDDILDIKGSKEELGKSPQKDLLQGKLTYVSLWGLDGAQKKADDEAAQALSCLAQLDNPTDQLQTIVNYVLTRTH
ncbi:polyprenyl synthetase family protein [bacterium]|mgnify:CR=1 FL=1|jgi:geranylgeranyl diphosphate synthase, type II|nr:polyprenyl synthetase family protein [bacterium]